MSIQSKIKYNSSDVVTLTPENNEVILSTANKYCLGDFGVEFDCPVYDGSIITGISVTTPPTKTSYIAGETLDITGLVVQDNNGNDITDECTFSPANGSILTATDTSILVSLSDFTATQSLTIISSISVITQPSKVSYIVGEILDLTGIVIQDNNGNNVTSSCTFSPANGTILSTSNNSVIITYLNLTCSQPISVVIPSICFTAQQASSTVSMTKNGSPSLGQNFQTSIDNGSTWQTFTPGSTTITLANIGDKVWFRGNNPNGMSQSDTIYYNFSGTGKLAVSGNMMSLLDNGACELVIIPNNYCFTGLFYNYSALIDASNLQFTATTLKYHCYSYIFEGTSITTSPKLPATNLAEYCYCGLFYRCSSLTTAPILPATTLAANCYTYMFAACTALQVWDASGSGHDKPWKIPSSGTASGNYAMEYMFGSTTYPSYVPLCPGSRSCGEYPNFNGVQKTFYTQNTPV